MFGLLNIDKPTGLTSRDVVNRVQRLPKTYRAVFLLGRISDTEDIEGVIEELSAPPIPTREQVESAVPPLVGTIAQRPPAYSALKVAGRRAYELARRGQAVELEPRQVDVHSMEIVRYDYPELEL